MDNENLELYPNDKHKWTNWKKIKTIEPNVHNEFHLKFNWLMSLLKIPHVENNKKDFAKNKIGPTAWWKLSCIILPD